MFLGVSVFAFPFISSSFLFLNEYDEKGWQGAHPTSILIFVSLLFIFLGGVLMITNIRDILLIDIIPMITN